MQLLFANFATYLRAGGTRFCHLKSTIQPNRYELKRTSFGLSVIAVPMLMANKVGNLMPGIERKLFCRYFAREKLFTAGLAAVACLVGTAASAQQASPAPDANQIETHVHNYGDLNNACLRWTDQCRTCKRDSSGNPVCSNIAISCQPVEVQCLERRQEQ